MPTLTNNFEGGSNGSAITAANSGGASGNAFDSVGGSGTGTTVTYSNAHPTRGSLGLDAHIPASAGGGAWVIWSTSLTAGTTGTIYARAYFTLTSFPDVGNGPALIRSMSTATGGNQRWAVKVSNTGQVQLMDQSGVIATSTTTLSLNSSYRVEVGGEGKTSGSIECRLYAGHATSPIETLGPFTAQNLGGSIFSVRFGVGAAHAPIADADYFLDDVGVSDATWLGPAIAVPLPKTWWPGALTDTGFTVAYNSTGISSAQLVASTASDLSVSPVTGSAVTVDTYGNSKVSVTGLAPDTVYYYGIKADGVLLDIGRGSLRTNPSAGNPASFSFAFGSCQQTNSNTPTFATIKNMTGAWGSARMLIHLGDLHYRDFGSSNTLDDIVSQYKSSIAASNLASLMSAMPMTYSWDNHDWGGANSNATTPRAADLKTAYRSFVPSYHLADADQASPTGAIYNSWVIGRVRFIDLDTRSERSNRTDAESSSKRMLSDQQEQWLYSQLLEDEPVKIICSGIYWRQDSINGDRWGSYSTQWTRIKNWFAAHPDVQAYVICGDRHALAADDGSSAGCYLPQAVGAAFDQGGIAASEAWTNGYYTHDGTNLKSFGWIDVTDNGSSITIDFTGYTSDGVERVSMSTTFAVTAGLAGYWGVPL